jgi:hypothetical protein
MRLKIGESRTLGWDMLVHSILPCHRDMAIGPVANIGCEEDRVETARTQNHHVPGIDTLLSSFRRLFVYLSYSLTSVQESLSVRSPWMRVGVFQVQLLCLSVV